MVQNLHESRFGSLCYAKNHNQLGWLLSEEGIQNGQWKKVVINAYSDCVTSCRNKDCNNYAYFLIILL